MPRRNRHGRKNELPKHDQLHEVKVMNIQALVAAFKAEAAYQRFCQMPECKDPRAPWNAHHVVAESHIKTITDDPRALFDPRNSMRLCAAVGRSNCHGDHHSKKAKVPVSALSEENIAFAVELLGVGPAYNYFARHYQGTDPRLEALIT